MALKNKNILVFVDYTDADKEIPLYTKFLTKQNIPFKITSNPTEVFKRNLSEYSHVFVDFGGIGGVGHSSMVEHFGLYMVEALEENEDVVFCFISAMGKKYYERECARNFSQYKNLHCIDTLCDKKEFNRIIEL